MADCERARNAAGNREGSRRVKRRHLSRLVLPLTLVFQEASSSTRSSFTDNEKHRVSRGAFRTSAAAAAMVMVRIVAFWVQLTPVDTVDGLAVSVKFSSLIHKSKSARLCLSLAFCRAELSTCSDFIGDERLDHPTRCSPLECEPKRRRFDRV